jgi:hypothetical protein
LNPEFNEIIDLRSGSVELEVHAAHPDQSLYQANLAEFAYRFNRRFDMAVMLSRLLQAAVTTAPQPLRTIRWSEACM